MTSNGSPTTFVTGYWPVRDNPKRLPEHYREWLPRTLDLVSGSRLIAFAGDDEVANWFAEEAHTRAIDLTVIQRPVQDLAAYEVAAAFVDSSIRIDISDFQNRYTAPREKGRRHLHLHLDRSRPATYQQILSTWLSKPALVAEIARVDGGQSDRDYAWIDVTLARFSRFDNWDVRVLTTVGPQVHHFGTMMNYRGRRLPLNASFLLSDALVWQTFGDKYWSQLLKMVSDGYPHDEETVISELYSAQPDLFLFIPDHFDPPGAAKG